MANSARATRVLLLLAALVSGCDKESPDDDGLGELGRVSFSYRRSCFFGCPLAQPLLAGTRETIAVDGDGDEAGVGASSSDPDVVELAIQRDCYCARGDDLGGRIEVAEDARCDAPRVKRCENMILVQARAQGDAELELHDADGVLLDCVKLLVREAARARFRGTLESRLGSTEATSFELSEGDTLALELTLFDARGRALLAPEAVHWTSSDAQVAGVAAFLKPGGAELDAGLDVSLKGEAVGQTAIGVEVPGLEASVQCRVVSR